MNMERHQLQAQVTHLLKRGLTQEEIRRAFDLPNAIIDEVIQACQHNLANEKRYQDSQQNQASFAMRL
jgi:alkylhydroperoxidase/carboxymuconolactone decarboxylase family protein YurZ